MTDETVHTNCEKQGFDEVDVGPRRDPLSHQDPKSRALWYDDLYIVFCVLVYIADVITDILVSVKYFNNGDYIWFSLTLSCVLGASLVMMMFSLKWFYDDTAEEVSKTRIVVFHLLQIGPLLRYWDAFFNGRKSRRATADCTNYYNIYVQQWRDLSMLRLFEVFIESAPQLVLQLYILAYNRQFDEERDWLTACSACLSLISLSTSIVSYSKALRDALDDKRKMSWWGFGCQIVWRFSMVASRIVTLVLFASVYRSWILLVIGLHWIGMTIWVIYQETSFCSNKTLERLFSVIIGFIYIFCFFNAKEGVTRKRLVIFYIVVFIEDCILLGMWLPYRHEYGVVFVAAVAVVSGGFALGVIAMFLYYHVYHPSLDVQGICVRTRHIAPQTEGIVRRLPCCNRCCHTRLHEEEPPTGNQLHIDIPASRGSVGRSVASNERRSPPFEAEFFFHEPSELQRQYSLEKQKIRKEKAERARRLHELENGMQNSMYLDIATDMPRRTESSECGQQSNGVVVNHEVHAGKNDAGDVNMNGYLKLGGQETTASEIKNVQECKEGVGTWSNVKNASGTTVADYRQSSRDGRYSETKGQNTICGMNSKHDCNDGLRCWTDDEETGTSSPKGGSACEDGLHCGLDDEETGTGLPKGDITCEDGLHCRTDDEETGTSFSKSGIVCENGLHCGADDEETGSSLPYVGIAFEDDKKTETSLPKNRVTCEDGLHCGTDDEKETETSSPKSGNKCEDGLHCGTDDEKETECNSLKLGTRCERGLHPEPDDSADAIEGKLKSSRPRNVCPKRSLNLSFHHRYSIVSDCISLSSSSSDSDEDVSLVGDEKATGVVAFGHESKLHEPRINESREWSDGCDKTQKSSFSTKDFSSGPPFNDVVLRSDPSKHGVQKGKQAKRLSFPNFVGTRLRHGRFSSLRRSREDVVDEKKSMMNRRHTGDFS